ncbi:MAG: ribonuclease P protein component [Clostridia bacterium]|nr:ribonuclease P protein component [Clostridia bacterium]
MQKAFRIRKNKQFHYVYRKGKGAGGREMGLMYVRAGKLQVGFSVSKKVGNAVTRNRVKRRMRECFRLQMDQLKSGFYVFTARPDAANASYYQLEKTMNGLLRRQKLYRDM